jgi:flagellar biosynthetic protein FliR
MSLTTDVTWIFAVMLVSLRLGVVVVMSPLLSFMGLPLHIRVALTLTFAALLVTGTGAASSPTIPTTVAGLVQSAAAELLIGGYLAFAIFAGFAVFQFAGRIMDTQLGFGVAGLIDPSTRAQAPLLGTVLNMAAVITFFAIGGHHLLFRGLAFSLEKIPPGAQLRAIPLDQIVSQFGAMFVFSAVLAAPVMIVILLVDMSMALMARTMPQMNVFIVGLPLKIFVGLAMLAISLGYLLPVFERVFASIFGGWEHVIGD